MIITIDGTSASGKTSAARALARRLGFALLRTGAMYRALALAAHEAGFDETATEQELASWLPRWQIDADETHVYLNGKDVSPKIDGNLMSNLSSKWAEFPAVREHVTRCTRQRAQIYESEGRSFVSEGRDQGSLVFAEAECKFYIDADVQVRAERRLKDLHHREDHSKTVEQLVAELNERDARDRNRPVGKLCIPDGSMQIDTTHMTKEAVVELLLQAVESRRGKCS